jgi:hypothetical protein
MFRSSAVRGAFAVALILDVFTVTANAFANGASNDAARIVADAPAKTATLTGTVKTPSGSVVSGATVAVSGPTPLSAVTDSSGMFTLTVAPGVYQILVTRNGYASASLHDLAVVAGESQPLTITMSQQDLSTLRVIGSVSTTRGGSSINTGAATQTYISGQTFSDLANPQINDVLQRAPDVTIQHMGSQADTTIIVGGAQPYETQVLIDGHPLALGQYGVWASQYFPSFLLGGAEVQSGPGNTTPFANIAVGGTVNLTTPGFTKAPTAEFSIGFDNYASQNSNLLATGSVDKLGYVVSLGTASANGPLFGQKGCVVSADFFSANDNTPQNTGTIQFCGALSGPLFTKGELLKFKYDFSSATSFEAGFTGAWSGYNPQGSAWGNSIGNVQIEACQQANPQACNNPQYDSMIGQTIKGYYFYPGSSVYNNQTLFDGQFRTTIGDNTLLVRPYVGNIEPEAIVGSGEGAYPAYFSAPGTVPSCPAGTNVFQCPNLNNPSTTSGPQPNAFEASCPIGNLFSYTQINSPQNTISVQNGREVCYQYPYSAFEQDKLYGSTFSLLHPFGDNLLNLTYDFHGQSTFAYFNAPGNVSVPLSTDRYSTISLTGFFHPLKDVGLNVGLYDTRWTTVGVQPQLDASGLPITINGETQLTGLQYGVSRFDPHVALTFRPKDDISLRASYGTSATYPFVGQVSGLATYQPPAGSNGALGSAGSLQEKNPSLQPEVSIEYGIGVDKRFGNGSVLALDLQNTTIHNVFENDTYVKTIPNLGTELITSPINAARLRAQVATLKYTYAPRVGFGFNASVAAERSIIDGIPLSAFGVGSLALPANNVQVCGTGLNQPGIPTCIPYLKGYGQFTYSWRDGTYAALGTEYEGKNNAYYQPPFAVLDLAVRRPVTKTAEFVLSVQNLLNTNAYDYLPAPGAGTAQVAGTLNTASDTSVSQATYVATRLPEVARTLHLQLRLHTGR